MINYPKITNSSNVKQRSIDRSIDSESFRELALVFSSFLHDTTHIKSTYIYIYISKTAIIVNKRMNPRTREKEKDRLSCFNSPGISQLPGARKNSGAEREERWKEEKNGFRRVSWERSRREFRLSALKQRGTTTAKLNTDRGRRRPCKTRPWIDLERAVEGFLRNVCSSRSGLLGS